MSTSRARLKALQGLERDAEGSIWEPYPGKLVLVHRLDDDAGFDPEATRCFGWSQDVGLVHYLSLTKTDPTVQHPNDGAHTS